MLNTVATPIIDQPTGFYTPGSVSFEMGLYRGSNVLANVSPAHDAALKAAASAIVPLCHNGAPPIGTCVEGGTGKIGFVELGLSVTLQQTCSGLAQSGPAATPRNCAVGTANQVFYQDQQGPTPSVNARRRNRRLRSERGLSSVLVQRLPEWDALDQLRSRDKRKRHVVDRVEAVSMEVTAGGNQSMALLKHNTCQAGDAALAVCYNEEKTAGVMRDLKARFPNIKIAYLYSRAYGGWGWPTSVPNTEPYAYESAWAVQFLILAQINQADNGRAQNGLTGDLSYAVAPSLSWGGYQWASATAPNSEGLSWPRADFESDDVHYTTQGYPNSSNTMIDFLLGTSNTGFDHIAYTTWFRATH